MDALGLTNSRLLIAILCGILVAFAYTYATVPHLVESPVQVITPVPTPPPVVIDQPISAPANLPNLKVDDNIWWLAAVMIIIPILLALVFYASGGGASSIISLLIAIMIMGITIYILRIVLDAMIIAMSQVPVIP